MEDILFDALLWALPAYVPLQLYLAWKWEGGWRIAALVPLLVMGPLVLVALLAASAQSNLWPVFLIFASPPACLYLLVLVAIRLFRRWQHA
jgi:hypothetical protein